jgi:hypothetical protein
MNAIEQAEIIYPLLVKYAKSRTTLTYRDVNNALGYKGNASGHAIRPGMDLIVLYCKEAKYPQLTSLIVNKVSGVPTDGYAYGDGTDIPDEHSKCYGHHWEKSFDYKWIWERRFEIRKKWGLAYGNSKSKKG